MSQTIPNQYANLPQSRYYGDRFPRTLQEAFGPYSTPEVARESWVERHIGLVVVLGLVVVALMAVGLATTVRALLGA